MAERPAGAGGGVFPLDGYDEDDGAAMAGGELEERVQTTQQRLAQLRQEAEALEREKQQFEELSRKQRSFMEGRGEMAGRLSRAVGQLDREIYEAQKRVEQLGVIRDSFTHHRQIIDSLNPEQWNPRDLPQDLTRALSLIDDAREEYTKAATQVASLAGSGGAAAGSPARASRTAAAAGGGLPVEVSARALGIWAFCGLGFTLPAVAIALLLYLLSLMIG